MPIRFFCEHCRQMLKIGTSKVGSVVNCPRCQKSAVVPLHTDMRAEQLYQMLKSKRAAEAATAPPVNNALSINNTALVDDAVSEPNAPESAWDDLGGNVDDAELNKWIEELWMKSSVGQSVPNTDKFTELSAPVSASAADEIALFTLQKRYKYTLILLYVSATIAFCVGLLFGMAIRGFYVQTTHPIHTAENGMGTNVIAGTIFFTNENGERRADVDAVIICLPMDRMPSPLFPSEGLRPEDIVNNNTVQLIHELGGMYGRADANGAFTLPYREGVRYLVIKISAHRSQPGGVLPPSILQELRRYFRDPDLFGRNSVHTDEVVWSGGRYNLRHVFE